MLCEVIIKEDGLTWKGKRIEENPINTTILIG